MFGGLKVQNTGPNQDVVLIRLVSDGGFGDLTEFGLLLDNCSGSVRVEGCTLRGADGGFFSGSTDYGADAIHVRACADVVFTACSARGGEPGETFSCSSGLENRAGNGLVAEQGSLVAAYQSSFQASDANEYDSTEIECGGQSANGATFRNSQLYAADSTFRGGRGGTEGLCGLAFPGGDGLRLEGATAHGDLLDVTLIGGPSNACGSPPGKPLVLVGGATSTSWPGPARTLTAQSPVRSGTDLPLTFTAPPGNVAVLVLSLQPEWADQISLLHGPWHSGSPRRLSVIGQVPPGGVLQHVVSMGLVPGGLESEVLYMQGLFLLPGGRRIGSPTSVLVLDAQF